MIKAYVMDAFSERVFCGNQAGVVLIENELSDETMQAIAAEFKHSETAFIHPLQRGAGGAETVKLRYFTPAGEVELCGHATVGSFALLRRLGLIGNGDAVAETKAGRLNITVQNELIWMDMAQPRLIKQLDAGECGALYSAFGLSAEDGIPGLLPQIVSTGLSDIIMPVRDRKTLLAAVQNEAAAAALSRELDCVGVHMFAPGEGECTAFCGNFAPLYGIPEECATGTANGALTYYLYLKGLICEGRENLFIQGERMGRPSKVLSRLEKRGEDVRIRIGGSAVMSMECKIML